VHAELAAVFNIPTEEFRRVWAAHMLDRDAGKYGDEKDISASSAANWAASRCRRKIEQAVNIRLALIRRNLVPRAGALEPSLCWKRGGFAAG